MLEHFVKCNGYDNLTCEFCHAKFSSRQSKCNHRLICFAKNQDESTEIIVPSRSTNTPQLSLLLAHTSTTNHIQTNNIQTVNGNNVNANNVFNIVVYQGKEGDAIQFDHSHMDPKTIKKFLVPGDKVQTEKLTSVMREWTNSLLANDNNMCIKKTNIRSSLSQVHTGSNKWETRLDKEVYPNLLNNIANDFSDYLVEKYKRGGYNGIAEFVDYMASDGYSGLVRCETVAVARKSTIDIPST